jgi:hypothetical protein
VQSIDDILSSVITMLEQGDELGQLLPVLLEAKRALTRGNKFSKEDVDRVADMIVALHGGGTLLEKVLQYAEQSGPNMFARVVTIEVERRRAERDQVEVLSSTNR